MTATTLLPDSDVQEQEIDKLRKFKKKVDDSKWVSNLKDVI